MNTKMSLIKEKCINVNIVPLNSKELKNCNGGGFLTEMIAWLAGAWSVHSQRIQMSSAEIDAFIEEHGMRDHW